MSRPPDDSADNAPAIVFLHGLGGDERNMIGVADHLPDDLHAFGVRSPFESSNGYSWVSASGRDRGGFRKGIDQLTEFVRLLPKEYAVDPDCGSQRLSPPIPPDDNDRIDGPRGCSTIRLTIETREVGRGSRRAGD